MADYKVYNFEVPETWSNRYPEMWDWDIVEALGEIGSLLETHREWFWETVTMLNIAQPHLVPLEDLPEEVVTTALVQVSSFNEISKEYESRRVVMSNGKIAILKKTIWRMKTDTERSRLELDAFGEWAIPEMLLVNFIVDIDGVLYTANDDDIRAIDESSGLLPSLEINKLARKYGGFVHQQVNKVVSLAEWKKKKKVLDSCL